MTSKQTAAVDPAGEEPLHASFSRLNAMMHIGELATAVWRAEQAVTQLHGIYVRKIRDYEGRYGAVDGRIDPRNHEHIAIIAYTMDEKLALDSARRKVHAARRRLRTACGKAACIEASTSTGAV